MSMLINFSPELSAWLIHNLERGCSTDDIVQSMVAQKFEKWVAEGLVETFQVALRNGKEPPKDSVILEDPLPDYLYETPRLSQEPVLMTSDRKIPVLLRIQKPVIALLEGVLSHEECDTIIELAKGRLKPSTVVDYSSGMDKTVEHRDSEGMFFKLQETAFISKLDRRISELMNCPIEHGEGLQVLRYGTNAKNTPHFDFLVPANEANKESIKRSGQRISTLVVYLNEVKAGGETIFPEIGLSVLPRKGNAVYFEYTNGLGQLDLKSVHAGAQVFEGEKWALTKWMRERPFVPAS